LVTAAVAFAGECEYVAVDLGILKVSDSEVIPGPELVKALEANPGCEVVAVDFVCPLNDMVKDYTRYFYDSDEKLLILLSRTAMKVGSDSHSWRIWYNIEPADFAERIPFGREDLKSKGSPYQAPKAALLQEYKGPEEATDWP
jgi:hypothetical protein